MRKTLLLTIRGILILFGFLVVSKVNSQPWLKFLPDGKSVDQADFYDIQMAFSTFIEGKDLSKIKGWKQFCRWEEFMEPRVYPSGKLPLDIIWKEKEKLSGDTQNKSTTANWTHMGPYDVPTDINYGYPSGVGRINCIGFHPTNQNIYWVGAPAGGLWKTIDNGQNWTTTTDNLASIGISDIAVNQANPNILYIATGDGDASDTYSIGVLKSLDGGVTFSTTGLVTTVDNGLTIRKLLINPTNPDILIASSNNGIYRTVNAGASWSNISLGNIKDIEYNPLDPNIVYASSYGYAGSNIFKSINGGASFLDITPSGLTSTDVYRIELAVTPDNSNVIYALCCISADDDSDQGFHSLYKSSNGGTTWTKTIDASAINLLGWESDGSDLGGQGWYDLALAVDPNDENIVHVGGVNLWKSTNGGVNFTINGHWWGDNAPYVHADQHILKYNPLNDELFVGNDGGIYKTANNGITWTDISDGLHILQIYKCGISATNQDIVITGAQDNGTMKHNAGTWNSIYGGDGMECIIDYTNSQTMYASIYYGSIYKSTDGGHNFNDVSPPEGGSGAWVTPYVMHPANNNTLYAGYTEVYKTTNGGSDWSAISTNLTGGENLNSLAVAPSNPNYLYAATYTDIWRTTNGGTNWTNISAGLPNLSIKGIGISGTDPSKIWVTFSGYTLNTKVFSSANGGSSWTNYSSGLPNLPVNCITYEFGSNNALYVGTDAGVYYTNASLSSWIPFNYGLPNVIVNELEILYSNGKLRAATFGRGLWESNLYSLSSNPEISLVSSQPPACYGDCTGTIDISVTGGTTPYTYIWSDGASTQDRTNLCAGSYTVTVADAAASTATFSTVIVHPTPLELTVPVLNNPTGFCDGSISVSVIGGTQPYSYQWSTGSSFSGLFFLCAGTYTVTIFDSNGCTVDSSIVLSPQELVVSTTFQTDASCNGVCDGSVAISLSGGTSPYSYSWSNGINLLDPGYLCAGVYDLTVTDAASATATHSVIIAQPPSIIIAVASQSNPSAQGVCDGDLSIFVIGGVAPYSYAWSNSSTNDSLTDLCAGTYTVTVSDGYYCTETLEVTLQEGATGSFELQSLVTNAGCFGSCEGEMAVFGSGGVEPYTYTWSTGETTQSITALCSGVYYVTVMDDSMHVATLTDTVFQNPEIVPVLDSLGNLSDSGICDAYIAISVSGGTSPYSYLWNDPDTQQTAIAINLCTGDYSLTITDSIGCSRDTSFSVGLLFLNVVSSQTNNSCFGQCQGSAQLYASGGIPPYTYIWQDGNNTAFSDSLCDGVYSVTVFDSEFDSIITSISITSPDELLFTANMIVEESCGTCCDGFVAGSLSGGSTPYNISWSNGSSTQSLTNLCDGSYYLTVTDANNCTLYDSVEIFSDVDLIIATSEISGNSCNSDCDAVASVSIISGTPPYSYYWSNGTTENIATGLCAGTYIVSVSDAAQKIDVDTIVIAEPGAISISVDSTSGITCDGCCDGYAEISASSGSGPLSYLWTDGDVTLFNDNLCGGFSHVTVTDSAECSVSDSIYIYDTYNLSLFINDIAEAGCTGNCDGWAEVDVYGGTPPYSYEWSNSDMLMLADSLCEGNYSVTVTDAMSITSIANISIQVVNYITPQIVGDSVTCSEQTVLFTQGTYDSYQWQFGNVDLIGDTTFMLITGQPGSYSLVVNSGTCQMETGEISVEINYFDAPIISGSGILCPTTNAAISVPDIYESFQWILNGVNILGAITSEYPATEPGNYTVIVEIGNCLNQSSVHSIVAYDDIEIITQPLDQQKCEGENATFGVMASGADISYQWQKDGFDISGETNFYLSIYSVGADDIGNYQCIISGPCGTLSTNIVLLSIDYIDFISVPHDTIICSGDNAIFELNVLGNNLTYQWKKDSINMDGEISSILTISNVTDADNGFYYCVVENGCFNYLTIPAELSINFLEIISQPSDKYTCIGDSVSFSIEIDALQKSYQWFKEFTPITGATQSIYNINPVDVDNLGSYRCDVTNGCEVMSSSTASLSLTDSLISVQPQNKNKCEGDNVLFMVGSVANVISYQWLKDSVDIVGADNYYLQILGANSSHEGFYSCIVTTTCGVDTSDEAYLNIDDSLYITTDLSDVVACLGSELTMGVAATGNGLEYLWTKDSYSIINEVDSILVISNISENDEGVYMCQVSGACGSVNSYNADLLVNTLQVGYFSTDDIDSTCVGTINLDVNDGTPPYQYTWSDSSLASTNILNGVCFGQYYVTIVDGSSCSTVENINVGLYISPGNSSVEEITEFRSISVYPNPVRFNMVSIRYEVVDNSIPEIEIFNLLGENININYLENSPGLIVLDISNISSGVYHMHLIDKDKIVYSGMLSVLK